MSGAREDDVGRIEEILGHPFADRRLCRAALTHRSWLNERPLAEHDDNERLEFLGDAVLALAVGDLLMKRHPGWPEGVLSKARAAIVSEAGLARIADAIGLGAWILLGRGEELAGGRRKPSILSDALEALLGAVFLDGGFETAYGVAGRLLGGAIEEAREAARLDFKSRLQERSQALLQATPRYAVVGESGPEHAKTFEVAVHIEDRERGRATGRSKKEAEQNAAAVALTHIEASQG